MRVQVADCLLAPHEAWETFVPRFTPAEFVRDAIHHNAEWQNWLKRYVADHSSIQCFPEPIQHQIYELLEFYLALEYTSAWSAARC